MSVILRLQNLPWAANALDIRTFFRGLSIPEGGVHIVGGELGDAFIAFSTDDDARQAMALDGTNLKDIRIRLMLSSRSEMQKVIEQARQQTLALQQTLSIPAALTNFLNQQPPYQSTPPQQPMQTTPPHQPQINPIAPQPPIISERRDSIEGKKEKDTAGTRESREKSAKRTSRDRSRSREKDRRRDRDHDRSRRRRSRSRERSRRRRSRSSERRRNDKTKSDAASTDEEMKAPPPVPTNGLMMGNMMQYQATQPMQPLLNTWPAALGFPNQQLLAVQAQQEPIIQTPGGPPNPFLPHMAPLVANMTGGQFDIDNKSQTNSRDAWSNENRNNFENRRESYDNVKNESIENRHNEGKFPEHDRKDRGDRRSDRNDEHRRNDDRRGENDKRRGDNDSRRMDGDNRRGDGENRRGDGENRRGGMDNRRGENDIRRGESDNRRGSGDERRDRRRRSPDERKKDERPNRDIRASEERPARGERNDEQVPVDHQQRGPYWNRPVNPGNCIELRNFPFYFKYREIRSLFTNMFIPNTGIKMQNDQYGRRTGTALIRFVHRRGKNQAMEMNGKQVGDYIVELVHIDDKVFDEAIDAFLPPRAVREQPTEGSDRGNSNNNNANDPWVSLKNLPPTCTENDIHMFFAGFGVEQVLLQSDGRQATGLGFVKVATQQEAEQAVNLLDTSLMGNRSISVSLCSSTDIAVGMTAKRPEPVKPEPVKQEKVEIKPPAPVPLQQLMPPQEVPPTGQPPKAPVALLETPINENNGGVDLKPLVGPVPMNIDCVFMNGLPPSVNDRDIKDFFSDIGLEPMRFHLMLDISGNPNGEAYCEFQNGKEVEMACSKNGSHLGDQIVSLKPIHRQEMMAKLRNDAPPHPPPNMPMRMIRPMHPNGGMRPPLLGNQPPMQNQYRPPFQPRPPMGMRGPFRPRMRGEFPRGEFPRGEFHPGMRPNFRPPMHFQPRPQQETMEEIPGLENFGNPGCVLSMGNVPYRAGIDDIIQFFEGFELNHEKVIRRYDEAGKPTADARVSFDNAEEAQRALQELNREQLGGRTIFLTVV